MKKLYVMLTMGIVLGLPTGVHAQQEIVQGTQMAISEDVARSESMQRPQPAILVAPQQQNSGTMSVALPNTQQLYSDLKQELQNVIVRLTAVEQQVESLMRTVSKQKQIRLPTPQEMRENRGALLTQQMTKSK